MPDTAHFNGTAPEKNHKEKQHAPKEHKQKTPEAQPKQVESEEAPVQQTLEERCHAEICPKCTVKQEADDIRLRALAEMDNCKKRLQREYTEQINYATEKVLSDLLPVLDNLDLAIRYGSHAEACKDMLIGVTMTRKLMLDALKSHGLDEVGEVGEPFNPEIHEAIAYEDRDDLPANHVSSLMQKGYILKGRLLRPAKVSVSRVPNAE